MNDKGINDQSIEVTENLRTVKRRRIGQLKLVGLAIRALRSNDPPEIRCQIALQLLRSIKSVNRFGSLPQRDTELLIQVQLTSEDWYYVRWVDYYRGCLFGSLIPLRSSWGKLTSELPANALRGVLQACYSKQVISIRHGEHINASERSDSQAHREILLGWAYSCLS